MASMSAVLCNGKQTPQSKAGETEDQENIGSDTILPELKDTGMI